MPNNVETNMWLVKDGVETSVEQAEEFFSQFISIDPNTKDGREPRFFDFRKVIPFPENIWLGDVGGSDDSNLKLIKELGGIEAVNKQMSEEKPFPENKHPCLSDKQIKEHGMVCGLDWCRENWDTKWNSYYCEFSWGENYGDKTSAHLAFIRHGQYRNPYSAKSGKPRWKKDLTSNVISAENSTARANTRTEPSCIGTPNTTKKRMKWNGKAIP